MRQLAGSLTQHPGSSQLDSGQRGPTMSAQHGMLAAYPMQLLMRATQAGSCHPARATQGQQVLDGSAGSPSSSCHSTWMWPPSIGALGVQVSIAGPAASLSSASMPLQKLPPGFEAQDVQVSSAGLADSLSSSKILSLKLPSATAASGRSTEQQSSRPMSGLSPHARDIFLGSPKRGLASSQPFKPVAMDLPAASSVPTPSGGVRAPCYRTAAHSTALRSRWAGCSSDNATSTAPVAQHKRSFAAKAAIALLVAAFELCRTC